MRMVSRGSNDTWRSRRRFPADLEESRVVVGDSVTPGMVVARLSPAPLDPRTREQGLASLEAARALRKRGEGPGPAGFGFVGRGPPRPEPGRGAQAGRSHHRQGPRAGRSRGADPRAGARGGASRERAAAQDERRARALLVEADSAGPRGPVAIRAPIGGRVLRVLEEHDRVVPAGTSLLEIGDPGELEVVADVLTRDVREIAPGAPMLVRVSGDRELKARVKRVEPAAFTEGLAARRGGAARERGGRVLGSTPQVG